MPASTSPTSSPEPRLLADFRILRHLLRGRARAGSHAARLQDFYAPQARHYDSFRERLLQGRAELIDHLDIGAGQHVVELGAGTGRTAEFFADRRSALASLSLVDLCPALLAQARARAAAWPNCTVVEADAGSWTPHHAVDRLYFSYSLSMMPEWQRALDNALAMLRPGGLLGVVDFYVSQAIAAPGLTRHGALTRRYWPWWFAHDGVRLSPEYLIRLRGALTQVHLYERRAPLPYLPGLRVPYYIFVGRRR